MKIYMQQLRPPELFPDTIYVLKADFAVNEELSEYCKHGEIYTMTEIEHNVWVCCQIIKGKIRSLPMDDPRLDVLVKFLQSEGYVS